MIRGNFGYPALFYKSPCNDLWTAQHSVLKSTGITLALPQGKCNAPDPRKNTETTCAPGASAGVVVESARFQAGFVAPGGVRHCRIASYLPKRVTPTVGRLKA
jgi:hypothetical protein